MSSVIIHGFKNEEAANAFINWYSAQGEQQIETWWSIHREEGQDIGEQPYVDIRKTWHEGKKYDGTPHKDDQGNLVVHVKSE